MQKKFLKNEKYFVYKLIKAQTASQKIAIE